jgi:GAF domain-containing protein
VEPIPETRAVLDQLSGDSGPLVDSLLGMGRQVVAIVPECVGLTLGLLEDGITLTLVASSEQVATLDAVQYLDGGPCVDGAHEDRTVTTTPSDLPDEHEWHTFARASAAAGVASTLTLPIVTDEGTVGSINLYASTPDAFDGHHEALAAAVGASAASAVTNADLSFATRLEAARGPERLADQDDVNIATGMIAAGQGVSTSTARERLREAAARAGITEAQAARAVKKVFTD